MGIGSGWLAPTLILLQKSASHVTLTLEECSWIASLEHFGKILGAMGSASFIDFIGRKPLMIISSLIFFLQWPITIFANSVLALYVSRVVFGFAWGINDGTNSVYLGEISSPSMRGIFGTFATSIYYLAVMIELVIATYFSFHTTATVNAAVTFLGLLTVFWLREPAQFLLMKGKETKALENFMWLKGVTDANDVKNEYEKISQNVCAENSKKSSLRKTLTSPANYKSVFLLLVIYALVALTGNAPIISFASIFFSETDIFSTQELTVLLGVSQFIVVSATSFIIDRFNRRSIIMLSFSLIALSHFSSALLYYINDKIYPVPYFSWLIFISITTCVSVNAFVYPVIFLIRSELFPLSIKAVGGCLSIISLGVFSLLATKMFMYVFTTLGIYVNFVIFGAISAVLVAFVYFLLPETRNKTLIEIQEVWEKQN